VLSHGCPDVHSPLTAWRECAGVYVPSTSAGDWSGERSKRVAKYGTPGKFEEDSRTAERAEDTAAFAERTRTLAVEGHRDDCRESWRSNAPCFTSLRASASAQHGNSRGAWCIPANRHRGVRNPLVRMIVPDDVPARSGRHSGAVRWLTLRPCDPLEFVAFWRQRLRSRPEFRLSICRAGHRNQYSAWRRDS
jgi:hypothetical protein